MHEVQLDLQQMEDSGMLPRIDEEDMVFGEEDDGAGGPHDEDELMGITNEEDMMNCDTTVVFGGGMSLDD